MDFHLDAVRVLANESSALDDRLNILSTKTYPSRQLNGFIENEIRPVNWYLRQIFLEEKAKLEQGHGSAMPERVSRASELFDELTRIVEAVTAADLKSHPLETMLFFKDVVRQLDSARVEFITNPKQEMNFGIREIWQSFRLKFDRAFGLKNTNTTQYVQLTFPTLHKDNPLLGAIYAHELGHFLDLRRRISEDIFLEAVKHNFEGILGNILDETGNAPSHEEAVLMLKAFLSVYVLKPWIRETVADTIGLFLLGPAFYLAGIEIDSFYSGHSYPDAVDKVYWTHPPHAFRNRRNLSLLKELQLFDSCPQGVRDKIAAVDEWWSQSSKDFTTGLVDLPGFRLVITPRVYELCEVALQGALPHITNAVRNLLPAALMFSEAELREVVPSLVDERLNWLIPPNEFQGKPVSAAAIINAGWFAYLTGLETIKARVKGYETDDRTHDLINILHELTKYALSASRVQRRWAEV